MGNGESTAKRISMQKTEEGTVQISQEVMSRLSKVKRKDVYEEASEDEIKMKEENLRQILNDAYQKGRKDGEKMAIKQIGAGSNKDQHSSKLENIEESMQQSNSEISELRRKLNELELLAESKIHKKQEMIEAVNKKLRDEKKEKETLYEKVSDASSKIEEQSMQLEQSSQKLEEERKQKEEYLKMLEDRDESIKVEFDRGVEDVQKVLRPLQKDVLCKELQWDVLECYKKNREHPLRCSNIVSEFRECVQSARRRKMEREETP